MAKSRIQSLPEQNAIERIVKTVRYVDEGAAPFALVLGAGFSRGLVPTTKELVTESLPLWMKSLEEGTPFESQKQIPLDQRAEIARTFWAQFVERNVAPELVLPLNPLTHLPEDYGAAYKAAFAPEYDGAVGSPAEGRKFQRALMRLEQPRLNAAHFLLASLLGVQPGRSRKSRLFKARAAFSRLILTTNFDPFLQTALQAVNRLYFMSDTPELGVSDEIFDDQTDAIHLVYLHGSIHRRSQAATDDDIRAIKEKNAKILAPVLKRHGVIVLGYSGWDDAIVEALAECDRFDHCLYWCGLESDPLAKNAFGPRVPDILHKPTTFYVQTAGAGRFMAQLCERLVEGLPRLLDNPIGQLREMLETIDLKDLNDLAPTVPVASNTPQLLDTGSTSQTFLRAQQLTRERLEHAEQVFLGRAILALETTGPTPTRSKQGPIRRRGDAVTAASTADPKKQVRQLLSSAKVAEALGNYTESLRMCNDALGLPSLATPDQIELRLVRARVYYLTGRLDDALADWTQVIQLPDAPAEQVAEALVNRGITWGQKGDTEKRLADCTRVIEQLQGTPVNLLALALVSRGLAWSQKGDKEKALADYTRVIEQLPGAPAEQVAKALGNRGWISYTRDDSAAFLADTEAALSKHESLESSAFNLGLALLACGRDAEAIDAYRRAAERFPQAIGTCGLADLEEAKKKWLTDERAQPVIQLLQSLKK